MSRPEPYQTAEAFNAQRIGHLRSYDESHKRDSARHRESLELLRRAEKAEKEVERLKYELSLRDRMIGKILERLKIPDNEFSNDMEAMRD